MTYEETRVEPGWARSARTAAWVVAGALAFGCGSAATKAAAKPAAGEVDSGPEDGVGEPSADAGRSARDAHDVEADAGGTDETGGTPTSAGDAGSDAAADIQCVMHGLTCSTQPGAEGCCTDSCLNGICGCLSEGSRILDGGVGACCDNLAIVQGGYCGTSACVPDGTTCGGDAGVVCCNDDCNGDVCGGT